MTEGWVSLCARAVQLANLVSEINQLIDSELQLRRDENERIVAAARLNIPFVPRERTSSMAELQLNRSQLERQLADLKQTLTKVLCD